MPIDRSIPYEPRFAQFCVDIIPYNYCSQFGEDSIIEKIFDRIGAENKWCFEVGANDGIFMSNTRRLIQQEGWGAVLVESEDEPYHKLAAEYWDTPNVFTVHRKINQDNTIDSIIDIIGVHPGLDLLVIDIDGQDYWALYDLKAHPRVLMVEFCPNDKDLHFFPERDGEGQAGEQAIRDLLELKNYIPICKTLVNIIAVRWELAERLTHGK